MRNQGKILLYKIGDMEKTQITNYFSERYEVVDESSCFTDILAIPAVAIFMDPEMLTEEELAQLNEQFRWDDTPIAFTQRPSKPDDIMFSYYIEDDLEELDGKRLGMEEQIELMERYDEAVRQKEVLLKEIDDLMQPDDHMGKASKTAKILNGIIYFRQTLDFLKHREELPLREYVAYRMELENVMMAMKLAYGLIDVTDVAPFSEETNEESEWIMNLADTLKKHRDTYLTNGNRYYRPSKRKEAK